RRRLVQRRWQIERLLEPDRLRHCLLNQGIERRDAQSLEHLSLIFTPDSDVPVREGLAVHFHDDHYPICSLYVASSIRPANSLSSLTVIFQIQASSSGERLMMPGSLASS